MRTKALVAAAAFFFTFNVSTAYAGADCPDQPKDSWLSQIEMQKRIIDMGYSIDKFKIDDNCYEIYGKDGTGRKVEIYFNPVTAEVVKKEFK